MNIFRRKNEAQDATAVTDEQALEGHEDLAAIVAEKTMWQKIFPILAAGSGLFSEGYVQSVCLRLSCLLAPSCAKLRLVIAFHS